MMFRRFFHATWILIATSLWMAVSPAHSEVKFNIKGIYGDKSGCKIANGQKLKGERGVSISSKGYSGHEWQCKIVWAHKEAGENIAAYHGSTVWSVITMCAGEGEAYSQLLSIQQNTETVIIRNGSNDPVILGLCK